MNLSNEIYYSRWFCNKPMQAVYVNKEKYFAYCDPQRLNKDIDYDKPFGLLSWNSRMYYDDVDLHPYCIIVQDDYLGRYWMSLIVPYYCIR